MSGKKSVIRLAILLGLICLSVACSGQTDEANKLINEANGILDKSRASSDKADRLLNELVGENLTKAEDAETYKTDNQAKFDEAVSLSEQSEKSISEAAAKFEQASKLKVDDKFKEYLGLKAQEFKKRAERFKAVAGFVKTFLAEKDVEKTDQLIADNNKKEGGLVKEADDLGAKAEKIIRDNPSLFKLN
ncbi:MAG: hypothetical protein AB1757_26510 [Acidobacteriota bacterium]